MYKITLIYDTEYHVLGVQESKYVLKTDASESKQFCVKTLNSISLVHVFVSSA